MSSLAQNRGIHQLIVAERKANDQINEAKRRRIERLKKARDEATADIAKFKKELDAKFERFENTHAGNRDDVQRQINETTERELAEIAASVEKNRSTVVQRMIDLVCDIQPDIHHNLHIMKQNGLATN